MIFFGYSGSLPSYIMDNSPYTCPQLRMVTVHFLLLQRLIDTVLSFEGITISLSFLLIDIKEPVSIKAYLTPATRCLSVPLLLDKAELHKNYKRIMLV